MTMASQGAEGRIKLDEEYKTLQGTQPTQNTYIIPTTQSSVEMSPLHYQHTLLPKDVT